MIASPLSKDVKVKFTLKTGHESPQVEYRYSSTLSLTSALDGVGGQRHDTAALAPGKTRYFILWVSNEMQQLAVSLLFHCKITPHVSGAFCTYHQEYIKMQIHIWLRYSKVTDRTMATL
jgi:hypothetical protein